MKNTHLMNEIGEIDEKYVAEAAPGAKEGRKAPTWTKWAAMAACLCLAAVGVFALLQHGRQDPNASAVAGGDADANSYMIAVYPEGEKLENIASATTAEFSAEQAAAHPLGAHLPAQLPEGFFFSRAIAYETVMKDGARYSKLLVEYSNTAAPATQVSEDGSAVAPESEAAEAYFTVCVWSFDPAEADGRITAAEAVTAEALEVCGGAYLRDGDACVGVFTEIADPAAVLAVIQQNYR
ncbi:MAG: hypothetical protein II437_01735 [Oscillospiraceae bacterium]|nr:hypothetical protein [Oscillospiraceae bacterium]